MERADVTRRPARHGVLYGLVALAMVLSASTRVVDLVGTGRLDTGDWVLLLGATLVFLAAVWAWSRERRRGM